VSPVDRSIERLLARPAGQNASKRRANAGPSLRRNEGFSLLEILVAFTLLAVAMGVLMQIFSSGVNGATLADRYAKAAMYAESKLAGVGVETELKESAVSGKFDDDFLWALVVRPYQDPVAKDQSVVEFEKLMPTQLYEVELKVSFTAEDRRERSVRLTTLRLGPKA
jgi:general secretion pathway protein I